MAFLNFRWPGSKPSAENTKSPKRAARAPQTESVEEMRRRARHRLIGASVLVLAGVLGFPLVFDSQPRPIPVNMSIDIPPRNQAAPLTAPGKAAQAPKVLVAEAGLDADEEIVQPAPRKPAKPEPVREIKEPAKPVAKAEPARPPVPVPPAVKPEPKPVPKPEPKPESKPTPKPAAAEAADERFIVQVGAFTEPEKIREVRWKLERAGLKTYAQEVNTKEGKRTRVRLGPFTSRAQAEQAAQRAKGLGLPVAILTL